MNQRTRRRLPAAYALVVIAALAVAPVGAAGPRVAAGPAGGATGTAPTGPAPGGNETVLPGGRRVTPAGRVSDLGDFPLGVAVSPDGRLVAAINSGQGEGLPSETANFCGPHQDADCPPGATRDTAIPTRDESLSVTDTRTGRVTTVTAVPTSHDPAHPRFNFFYVGVAFSPDGRHLYAAGGGNDAVYDFPVRRDMVDPRPAMTVTLPDTVKNQPQLVPSYGTGNAFTAGLAVTPNGRYVLVAHQFQNTLDIVDTRAYSDSQVILSPAIAAGGAYPYGVAVSRDGGTAYVTEQGLGAVAVITLLNGTGMVTRSIPVGDHPTGIAISPDGSQVYVANADDDTLSIISTLTGTVSRTLTLHAFDGEALGSTPNAVAVSPDGQRVYVALAGDDAVAVLGTQDGFDAAAATTRPLAIGARAAMASPATASFVVGGMIPTGWYPSAVATSPDGRQIYIVSAKGLGARYPGTNLGPGVTKSAYSDKLNMPGLLQTVPAPSGAALTGGLDTVRRDILAATNTDTVRGAHNPIPDTAVSPTSPLSLSAPVNTPIKYVVEIVRENRTFDQELGDIGQHEGRGESGAAAVNAEPAYTTFGRDVTPNAHALVGDPTPANPDPAYATSDNFYSDGEASVQGHWWTAAANVNDYVEKSWYQYYSDRNHVQDTVSPVSSPHNCTIFQSALLRQAATAGQFSFRDYGELVGVANPSLGQPSLGPVLSGSIPTDPRDVCTALPDANFSLAASSQLTLTQDDRKTARGFLGDVGLNEDGTETVSGTAGLASLRNFSYIIMGEDHTYGLDGPNSPRAVLAQNDAGIGMVVQALSHSKYWPNTAIFVMEDDSQDGLDHVDGHRNLLYVISPYAKHTGPDGKPGYIGHLHYSQASVLKTMELVLGLPYLSTYDQNATALYDLFQDKDGAPGHTLTADDLAPYTVQPAPSFIDETAAQVKAQMGVAADPIVAESKRLDLSGIDRAGPELEIVDWQLAHPDRPVPARLLDERRAWDLRLHIGGADGDG